MSKYYKEKHLRATLYKIEAIKEESSFVFKHFWRLVAFGIIISLRTPYDISKYFKNSLKDREHYYIELVLIFAVTYILFVLVFHFSSKYQNNHQLKKLLKLKDKLEREIIDLY